MTAAAMAAMIAMAGLAQAQGNPAPPPDPASPGAQPTTSHSPDTTLPFQGPGVDQRNPQLAANTGCEAGGNKETAPPGQQNEAAAGRQGRGGSRLPSTPTFCP
jgi:hypothetical protein